MCPRDVPPGSVLGNRTWIGDHLAADEPGHVEVHPHELRVVEQPEVVIRQLQFRGLVRG